MYPIHLASRDRKNLLKGTETSIKICPVVVDKEDTTQKSCYSKKNKNKFLAKCITIFMAVFTFTGILLILYFDIPEETPANIPPIQLPNERLTCKQTSSLWSNTEGFCGGCYKSLHLGYYTDCNGKFSDATYEGCTDIGCYFMAQQQITFSQCEWHCMKDASCNYFTYNDQTMSCDLHMMKKCVTTNQPQLGMVYEVNMDCDVTSHSLSYRMKFYNTLDAKHRQMYNAMLSRNVLFDKEVDTATLVSKSEFMVEMFGADFVGAPKDKSIFCRVKQLFEPEYDMTCLGCYKDVPRGRYMYCKDSVDDDLNDNDDSSTDYDETLEGEEKDTDDDAETLDGEENDAENEASDNVKNPYPILRVPYAMPGTTLSDALSQGVNLKTDCTSWNGEGNCKFPKKDIGTKEACQMECQKEKDCNFYFFKRSNSVVECRLYLTSTCLYVSDGVRDGMLMYASRPKPGESC